MEGRYKARALLSPLMMAGEVLMETRIPFIMANIIDMGIARNDISCVVRMGLRMAACALLSLLFGTLGARSAAVASQGFSLALRRRLFSKTQEFSFSAIDKFGAPSIVTRLTTDVTNAQNVFQMCIRICARAPMMLIAGVFMALKTSADLAKILLLAIPVLGAAIALISRAAYPRFKKMLEKYDAMNATVRENLAAIRVAKAFARGEFESAKFSAASDGVRETQARAERLITALDPIMMAVMFTTMIAAMSAGGGKVIRAEMQPGALVSFTSYVTQVLSSLMTLGMIFVSLVMSRASIERICAMLDEKPGIENPDGGGAVEIPNGDVEFRGVSFFYPSRPGAAALDGINLKIESGSLVGIVGGTGSSKTTLVSLIPRLYDATSGSVLVAGRDTREYNLRALRSVVSIVLQDSALFSGSIRGNLRWGDGGADEEKMSKACAAADIERFVMSLGEKYDAPLGQGGVNLSGGQKQRLCIARALLKNPKILILDDSMSAVDMATEARIEGALREVFPSVTKIVIAQRISSVKNADKIIVMDNGKIAGAGTHEELLESSAIYREICESQRGAGDADLEG